MGGYGAVAVANTVRGVVVATEAINAGGKVMKK